MNNKNINIYNTDGKISTNDENLNKIIEDIEDEGIILTSATSGIIFEGENPDEKAYLVLLSIYDISEENSGDVMREWNIKVGRQNTYDYLKELVKNEAIDPNTSFIIAGDLFGFDDGDKINIKFNDISPATVFRFLKIMRENNKVLDGDETFDINEFDINGASGDTTIVQV